MPAAGGRWRRWRRTRVPPARHSRCGRPVVRTSGPSQWSPPWLRWSSLKVGQTWLADPPVADAGVVVALLCGLAASSAVWRGEEVRAVRLRYVGLQFAQRCVSGTRARVRAAESTVPLAAGLVGPVDRARDAVRRVCRKLRLDRNRALRGLAAFDADVHWERTILLAHLEVQAASLECGAARRYDGGEAKSRRCGVGVRRSRATRWTWGAGSRQAAVTRRAAG